VSHWLRMAAEHGYTTGFGAFYPEFFLDAEALWTAGLHDPRLTTASAHNIRLFVPAVQGRRMHYFTLLRQPRAQMISALRYMLQEREGSDVPADLVTTHDAAKWLLTGPIDDVTRENVQTNHLALFTWCAATAGRCDPAAPATWTARDRAAYKRERLNIAKDVLDGFLVAGTVERLMETMTLVRDRSGAFGVNLPPVEMIGRVNVTSIPAGDSLAWLDSDPAGDGMRASVAEDLELYAYANALLDEAADAAEDGHGEARA
jgi:hypothetical protein